MNESGQITIGLKWPILVVEPDNSLFDDMRKELIWLAGTGSLVLTILHATTLVEARRKRERHSPAVISSAWRYPRMEGQGPSTVAGGELLGDLTQHGIRIPAVVYSNVDPRTIQDGLRRYAYRNGANLPPIIQKRRDTGHSTWASAVLRALHSR